VRATQLAIDCFIRQNLGHGVVVIVSSTAAQTGFLPTPLYCASKHAISGFTRSLADLEPKLNIRVNAVAPGRVKTPLWTKDNLTWVNQDSDRWVTTQQVAEVMLELVTNEENVGGTILEVGGAGVRIVGRVNDPGPQGKGLSSEEVADATANVYKLIGANYGK
jgi:NAD(P)-dependent dehydrogenase (short-subunit alcohol dehydrogenase family)